MRSNQLSYRAVPVRLPERAANIAKCNTFKEDSTTCMVSAIPYLGT